MSRSKPRETPDDDPEEPSRSSRKRPDRKRRDEGGNGPVNEAKETVKVETRMVADLLSFPHQGKYYDKLSDTDAKALAESIRRRGLRDPIEILPQNRAGHPPNTMIDGEQRLNAVKALGMTEVAVRVRYDLAEATAEEIEQEFLSRNHDRRQLDALAKARVTLRRYELETGESLSRYNTRHAEKARARVGEAIGMSGRNLQRYWLVLRTPQEVQDAFRAGKLPLVAAARVAGLPAADREMVARRIRGGEDPKEVVRESLPAADGRHRRVSDAVAALARSLARGLDDLQGRLGDVRPGHVRRHLPVLRRAGRFIKKLRRVDGDLPRRHQS